MVGTPSRLPTTVLAYERKKTNFSCTQFAVNKESTNVKMMFAPSALLFFLLPLYVSAQKYTYFEEGGKGVDDWATLDIEGNQCAGDDTSATEGFGQSPIALETGTCDGDMSGYTFTPGDCAWEDLTYTGVNNGVLVKPTEGVTCTFGTMKVPNSDSNFNLAQFHLHTNAEHSIDDSLTRGCLHGVHLEEDGGDKAAVFGLIMDDSEDTTNDYFEYLLQAWEANWQTVVDDCNANPPTDANVTFEPQQTYVQCPVIAESANTFNTSVTFPDEPFNLYEGLVTVEYGAWNYGGGLTTPPCTEFAYWNVIDQWLYVSEDQMNRFWLLTNCYIDTEVCTYQTIANTDGSTNRPVQDIGDRTVNHHCVDFAADGTNAPGDAPADTPGGTPTGTSGVGISSIALSVIGAAASTMALFMI